MSDEVVAIEHRIIVRHERTGPRTYCYCGWASKLAGSYDEMVADLYVHLGRSTETDVLARPATTPSAPEQPTLF